MLDLYFGSSPCDRLIVFLINSNMRPRPKSSGAGGLTERPRPKPPLKPHPVDHFGDKSHPIVTSVGLGHPRPNQSSRPTVSQVTCH
jgi:hypothetical protein